MFSLNLRLIVISIIILVLDFSGFLAPIKRELLLFSAPFEEGLTSIGRTLSQELESWSELFTLREENKKLKFNIENLQIQLLKFKELSRENDLLKEQLKIGVANNVPKVVLGRIIGKSLENPNEVIIDQGDDSGLRIGDLVIYKGFVYGRVIKAMGARAGILLITDPRTFFDALDIDSRNAKGEVRGNFGTSLTMEKILPTEKINTGDTIVESTSGFILGKVERVKKEGAEILKSADLVVPYDIDKVEKVFVLVQP